MSVPFRLRPPAAPVPAHSVDLYFYPIKLGSPVLRIKSQPDGYLFQLLDATCDVQAQTFHVGFADALMQVVLRMRVEGLPDYRVEAY